MAYSCLHLSVEVVKFFMIRDPFERIFLWLIPLYFLLSRHWTNHRFLKSNCYANVGVFIERPQEKMAVLQVTSYYFTSSKLHCMAVWALLPAVPCDGKSYFLPAHFSSSSETAVHQLHGELKQRDPSSPSCQKKYSWSHSLEQHRHRNL